MQLQKKTKSGKIGNIFIFFIFCVIIAAGSYVAVVFFENEPPTASFDREIKHIGTKSEFSVSAADQKSGLKSVKLYLQQGSKEHVLVDESFPRKSYTGVIGPQSFNKDIRLLLKETGLDDGEASLILQVKDFSLRGTFTGNTTEIASKVILDTKPPKTRLLHAERYIRPGESGIVIYQLIGDADKHGAQFGGHFHPGHLIGDGRDDVYIAYIGLPHDAESLSGSNVIAVDKAGNTSSLPFSPVFKNAVQKKDRINVGDGFLGEKIPEFETYYPQLKGDNTEKYIYVNNKIRSQNNRQIFELCQNPLSERLWEGRFDRMAGASKAGFADHRTYYYQNKEIDNQVHLGMDIASIKRAEVKAANKGKVVFAGYLGIYGNMVLLDHGQGVFSLYSHLSQVQVAVDDVIDKDIILGLTGKSGMAGGDHLHFSMLINGIFVTPKEWWDAQWIEVTIENPIFESKF